MVVGYDYKVSVSKQNQQQMIGSHKLRPHYPYPNTLYSKKETIPLQDQNNYSFSTKKTARQLESHPVKETKPNLVSTQPFKETKTNLPSSALPFKDTKINLATTLPFKDTKANLPSSTLPFKETKTTVPSSTQPLKDIKGSFIAGPKDTGVNVKEQSIKTIDDKIQAIMKKHAAQKDLLEDCFSARQSTDSYHQTKSQYESKTFEKDKLQDYEQPKHSKKHNEVPQIRQSQISSKRNYASANKEAKNSTKDAGSNHLDEKIKLLNDRIMKGEEEKKKLNIQFTPFQWQSSAPSDSKATLTLDPKDAVIVGPRSFSTIDPKSIAIKDPKKMSAVDLKGTTPIDLRSTTPIELRGTAPIEIKVTAPIDLRGNAPLELRNAPVDLKSMAMALQEFRSTATLDLKSMGTTEFRSTAAVDLKSSATVGLKGTKETYSAIDKSRRQSVFKQPLLQAEPIIIESFEMKSYEPSGRIKKQQSTHEGKPRAKEPQITQKAKRDEQHAVLVEKGKKNLSELVDRFVQQIKLDEPLRNFKIWFTFCSQKDKWELLKQKLAQKRRDFSLKELKATFESTPAEHNPFFKWDTIDFDEGLKSLVEAYEQSDQHYKSLILKRWSREALESAGMRRKLQYNNKVDTISEQDLVGFINLEKDMFLRNRDVCLLYRRLRGELSAKLFYHTLLDAVTGPQL